MAPMALCWVSSASCRMRSHPHLVAVEDARHFLQQQRRHAEQLLAEGEPAPGRKDEQAGPRRVDEVAHVHEVAGDPPRR
jgi:hypothetical protein